MRLFDSRTLAHAATAALVAVRSVRAISLNVDSTDSIRDAASQIAYDMVSYYTGNDTGASAGLLPFPYYWWEAGAMWDGLINYWHLTGDSTYNSITSQALLANIGPDDDFMVPTQEFDEGNDDQDFWGMAALTAAETSFPSAAGYSSWLELAEAMWNNQLYRWDLTTCGGGLRWQIYPANAGYDYKSSITNGAFFQMAARLLKITGNDTYLDWAETVWDWSTTIGIVQPQSFKVYDGTSTTINCTQIDADLWTYQHGVYLLGAAIMYEYTGLPIWETRTTGLLAAAASFFSPYTNATSVMYEPECEETSTCNVDQQSFKAFLSRDMWRTTQVAPYTSSAINTLLRASAMGAAASCDGVITDPKATKFACGSRWYTNEFDNVYGVGQQLSALEVIQGLLLDSASASASSVLATTAPVAVSSTSVAVATPVSTLTSTPIATPSSVATEAATSLTTSVTPISSPGTGMTATTSVGATTTATTRMATISEATTSAELESVIMTGASTTGTTMISMASSTRTSSAPSGALTSTATSALEGVATSASTSTTPSASSSKETSSGSSASTTTPTSTVSSTATRAATSASSSATASTAADTISLTSSHLNTGAMAGGIVGGIAFLALLLTLVSFIFLRRRRAGASNV